MAGVRDAAGADLWFNGQPAIVPNMQVFAPTGGKVVDGSKVVGSGVPMDGPAKPFKVRFPKKGTYTMLCAIHPGMKARVKVKRAGADVPSAKRDAKRMKKQARAASKLAKRLMAGKGTPGGDTVRAGNDHKGVATLAFFPDSATVKAGEAVTFEMSKGSTEIHNVAFGPQEYIGGLAQSFFGPQGMDPMTAYPSDPPGTALALDGANHGNGYLNTGILDAIAGTPQPDKATVTFAKPGTYAYYCVVHGAAMKGSVTVTS
ncbi:MAG: plastocyanin/azurin family copper-binding protein [Solirubrobacteraceae bacterium]